MYKIIAECVDSRNGKRYYPGGEFDPSLDDDEVERLTKAKCIKKIADDSPEAASLENHRVADLKALASLHNIDVSACRTKADFVAALQAAGVSPI